MRLRSRRSMRRTREGEEDCQGGHPRVGAGQQAEANLDEGQYAQVLCDTALVALSALSRTPTLTSAVEARS